MRYDQRYSRVKAMITDQAIPRTASGGIRLCKWCQREIYWVGGFLKMLARDLDWLSR